MADYQTGLGLGTVTSSYSDRDYWPDHHDTSNDLDHRDCGTAASP